MCEVAGRVTGSRLEKVLDAAIQAADLAQAIKDAEAVAERQGVWPSREDDNGYATLFARAPAPHVRAADVSLDELARALTILGDTDSHDIRRAKALGLMADPAAALETIRLANEALNTTEPPDPRRRPCELGPAILYVHLTDQSLAGALTGRRAGSAGSPTSGRCCWSRSATG